MSALRGGNSEIYCREPAAKYRWAFFVCGIEQRAKKGEDEIFLRDAERTRRAFFVCGIGQRAKKGEDETFLRDAKRTRRAFLCVELGNVQRRVKTRLFYAMRSARGGLFSCGTIEGVWRFSYRAGECAAFLMRDDRDTADIYKAGRR